MNVDHPMYRWRSMTSQQREAVLAERQQRSRPWHGPPHYHDDGQLYLLTAACYEHKPLIGFTAARMSQFEADLLEAARSACRTIFAWIVLPNHYHFLAHALDIKLLLRAGTTTWPGLARLEW